MRISSSGVAFIKGFEGFSPVAYDDGVGVKTIGYGFTTADLHPLPRRMTEAEASKVLLHKLDVDYEPAVRMLFSSGPLHGMFNQHRYDMFVSGVFNLGTGYVKGAQGFETMWQALCSRDVRKIANAMTLYSDPGTPSVHAGLLRRRLEEARRFLQPMGRFEYFTAKERDMILSWDSLRGHTSTAARFRRAALAGSMHRQLNRIRAAVQTDPRHDWTVERRHDRAEALKRRIAES